MPDLTTISRILYALPNLNANQSAGVQGLLTAASRVAERYCNRHFWQADYVEIRNLGIDDALLLRNFPVNSVNRVSVGLSPVLSVKNTDPTVQRSSASLATTGTFDSGFTVTGISLASMASGVQTKTLIPIAGNPTILSLANAISLISGWVATVQGTYGLWPSSDLIAVVGGQASTMNFMLHTADSMAYTVDPAIGEIRVDPMQSFMGYSDYPWTTPWGSSGTDAIRVEYNAGFAAIPDDVQEAVVMIAQMMFEMRVTSPLTTMEKLYDYEIETRNLRKLIPDGAMQILDLYKDYRASGDY